ncbi:MAG: MipA/OmpV family protein [Hyphomicrobiaceae bacterium]
MLFRFKVCICAYLASVLALGLAVTGISTPALAGGDWDPGPTASGRSVHVGGGVGIKPKYEGSDEYEAIGIPLIIPEFGDNPFAGRLQFRGIDDIRYELLRSDPSGRSGFVAGPVAGYRFEREQDDGDLLRGLGDVDGGFVGGAFVGYRFGILGLDVAYKHQFGDDDPGYLIDLSASVRQRLSPTVEVTGRFGSNYADEDYTQTFFGVTAAQAATSTAGLQAFDTDDGFKDIYGEVGAKIELTERWTARGQVRYSRLIGDAADSPIVENENQFSGGLGLTYRFDLGR